MLYPQSTLFPLPLSGTELFPKTVRLQELLPKQEERPPFAPSGTASALFLCVCFLSSFFVFFLGFFSGSLFVFAFFVFCFCDFLLQRQFNLIPLNIQNAGLVIPVSRGARPADDFVARRS